LKYRIEPQGFHYYDRVSGYHLLFDEVDTRMLTMSIAPRTVSIAITNFCDFTCPHCYVPMTGGYIEKDIILKWALELDKLGTFELSLGGGEPTLHPDFTNICKEVWNLTSLGISVTTHGYHLNEKLINEIKETVSFVRVSIDGLGNTYKKMRQKEITPILNNLTLLKGKIPFGINIVISRNTLKDLDGMLKLAIEVGAEEILLLPLVHNGKFIMRESEWIELDNWVCNNYKNISISINKDARQYLKGPFLFQENELEDSFGYIGANYTFRNNSYIQQGINMNEFNNIEDMLMHWNKIE
jgi:molybdenum cofactor biosynthesis enzyme MoaA